MTNPDGSQLLNTSQPGEELAPNDIPLSEDQRRQFEDWKWCLSQPELHARYGTEIVGVYRKQVWGYGKDHLAAVQSVEANLGDREGIDGVPYLDEVVFVVMWGREYSPPPII